MTKFAAANKKVTSVYVALAIIAIGVVAVSLTDFGKRLWFPQRFDAELQESLIKPLRLEATQLNAFEEFALALRAFHYRVQPRNSAVYSDIFYDTEDWRLYRNGYSYRYREAKNVGGKIDYAIRLEQEPQFVPVGSKKTDLRETLPPSLGAAISQGAWERALANDNSLKATAHLLALLQELDIAPEEIRPRLAADLRRERYDITDKGRNWFELDREFWSFHLFEVADRVVEFEEFVVDTRLNKKDPELIRRVVTLNRLSGMTYGVRATDRAPHERAIEELGFGTVN